MNPQNRKGLFIITLLLILPRFFGLNGRIYRQPLADLMTLAITLVLLAANSRNLAREEKEWSSRTIQEMK